jgi:hypothetical protein
MTLNQIADHGKLIAKYFKTQKSGISQSMNSKGCGIEDCFSKLRIDETC